MGEKVMTMKSSNLFESVSLSNSQGKQMVMYFKQGRLGEIESWIQFKEYLFESMMDRQLDFSTQHSNGERENVEKKSCAPFRKKSQRHKQQIGLTGSPCFSRH